MAKSSSKKKSSGEENVRLVNKIRLCGRMTRLKLLKVTNECTVSKVSKTMENVDW